MKCSTVLIRDFALVGVAVVGLTAMTGCGPQAGISVDPMRQHPIAKVPLDPDIIRVVKFFSISPWINFDPNNSRKPGGFAVEALYLVSARTERGAFGDGIIRVIMTAVDRDEKGKKVVREVQRWSFDPEEALPYRLKEKQVLGYGYQLRCNWGDADVLGKEIAIRVEFERRDGRVITGQANHFLVPTG
jgi:hypothetical protein